MYNWLFFLFGALCLILIPFSAKLVQLRIRFLRGIRWEWAAKQHEKYFQATSWFFRVVFLVAAVVLFYFGWTH